MSEEGHTDPIMYRLAVWSGPVLIGALTIGFFPLARYFPPPRHQPTRSATEIANWYVSHLLPLRVGLLVTMIFFALFALWSAATVVWIRKMERGLPILTYSALISAAGSTMFFELIPLMWAVAAYRPDTDPEVTRIFHDVGWFMVLYSWPIFSVYMAVLGLAILRAAPDRQYLPRWVGYLSIWAAMCNFPAGIMDFTKVGPLAYNGWLAFWVPFTVFFIWMVVVTIYLLKAIKLQEMHAKSDGDPTSHRATEGKSILSAAT